MRYHYLTVSMLLGLPMPKWSLLCWTLCISKHARGVRFSVSFTKLILEVLVHQDSRSELESIWGSHSEHIWVKCPSCRALFFQCFSWFVRFQIFCKIVDAFFGFSAADAASAICHFNFAQECTISICLNASRSLSPWTCSLWIFTLVGVSTDRTLRAKLT